MTRTMIGLCVAAAFAGLVGCAGDADYGSGPQRGIDADISATHDAGAPTIRNEGPKGSELWRISEPHPIAR